MLALDLALKRLEADAIRRKCMGQRACRTQAVGLTTKSKIWLRLEGELRE